MYVHTSPGEQKKNTRGCLFNLKTIFFVLFVAVRLKASSCELKMKQIEIFIQCVSKRNRLRVHLGMKFTKKNNLQIYTLRTAKERG